LVEGTRDAASWIIGGLAAVAVAAIVGKIGWPDRSMLIPGRAAMVMIVTLVLGPALLVNTILKPHWPRPRPGAVHELGGPLPFVAWWDPRGGCDGNCSFVSGEVSGAAWTFAPAALTPMPWRVGAIAGAVAFTAVVALVRIVQGGHFTSDALFAATFTALVVWLVFGAVYRWPRTRVTDAAVETWLAKVGRRLRG
jgi:membrane-associated PAP2 superfamily phosphatase